MDNLLTNHVHQRKTSNKAKSKKKPVKVVYISNPMKIKTSASKFRALVQELTGQNADPTKFPDTADHHVGRDNQRVQDEDAEKLVGDDDREEIPIVDSTHEQPQITDFSFESFDDFFTPQSLIMENFPGFGLFSSSLCGESSQVDVVRSLDAI